MQRKPYPIPKIADTLHELGGFRYCTALDLSMGYWHIRLDTKTQEMCTITFPFGTYKYKRLPMGIVSAPDIFQGKMNHLMSDLEWVCCYLDDILCITKDSFTDHLNKLKPVLDRLESAGFRVNLLKSTFAMDEIEYLGYWLTREGIKPHPKKVEAIKNLDPPKTRKGLRRILGIIQYYRDMWKGRSQILAPLTHMSSKKVPFKWTAECQKALDEMKEIVSQEVMLMYPDFNKPFNIYTDASDIQLGAVITQKDSNNNNRLIAFYSRKLIPAQTRYTTTERELLSIVETCSESWNILLGYPINIYTDHKNLMHDTFLYSSDRVMRWVSYLSEFRLNINYIKGPENVVTDGLSRAPATGIKSPKETPTQARLQELMQIKWLLALKKKPSKMQSKSDKSTEIFDYPIDLTQLKQEQFMDKQIRQHLESDNQYDVTQIEDLELVTCNGLIVVPQKLVHSIIEWYHHFLCHPGIS